MPSSARYVPPAEDPFITARPGFIVTVNPDGSRTMSPAADPDTTPPSPGMEVISRWLNDGIPVVGEPPQPSPSYNYLREQYRPRRTQPPDLPAVADLCRELDVFMDHYITNYVRATGIRVTTYAAAIRTIILSQRVFDFLSRAPYRSSYVNGHYRGVALGWGPLVEDDEVRIYGVV